MTHIFLIDNDPDERIEVMLVEDRGEVLPRITRRIEEEQPEHFSIAEAAALCSALGLAIDAARKMKK